LCLRQSRTPGATEATEPGSHGATEPHRHRASASSLPQVPIKKLGDLLERLLRLWRIRVAHVLRVRLSLVDVQLRFNAGLPHLAMNAYGVAEQQIARAGGQ